MNDLVYKENNWSRLSAYQATVKVCQHTNSPVVRHCACCCLARLEQKKVVCRDIEHSNRRAGRRQSLLFEVIAMCGTVVCLVLTSWCKKFILDRELIMTIVIFTGTRQNPSGNEPAIC